VFETLTLTTILLTLFFFYQNKRLGLDSAIPKDPNQRMRFYCSECLAQLKMLLPQAKIAELNGDSLSFVPANQTDSHKLEQREGKLWLRVGDAKAKSLGELGKTGRVTFQRSSDTSLGIDILAENEGASHSTSVRLQVSYL
jgi:hypothetical protein